MSIRKIYPIPHLKYNIFNSELERYSINFGNASPRNNHIFIHDPKHPQFSYPTYISSTSAHHPSIVYSTAQRREQFSHFSSDQLCRIGAENFGPGTGVVYLPPPCPRPSARGPKPTAPRPVPDASSLANHVCKTHSTPANVDIRHCGSVRTFGRGSVQFFQSDIVGVFAGGCPF